MFTWLSSLASRKSAGWLFPGNHIGGTRSGATVSARRPGYADGICLQARFGWNLAVARRRRRQDVLDVRQRSAMSALRRLRTDTGVAFAQILAVRTSQWARPVELDRLTATVGLSCFTAGQLAVPCAIVKGGSAPEVVAKVARAGLSVVNVSTALALAFVALLACLPDGGAAQGFSYSHPHRHGPRLHQRVTAARRGSATRTPAQGAPMLERSVPPPRVTNDSDGLSRDPEDCNKGCLGNSE